MVMTFTIWERLLLLLLLGQEKGTKDYIAKVLYLIRSLDLKEEEARFINFKVEDGVIEWNEEFQNYLFKVQIDEEVFREIVPRVLQKYESWTPNDLRLIMEMGARIEMDI